MPLQPTRLPADHPRPGNAAAVTFDAPALAPPSLSERRREYEKRIAKDREQGYSEGYALGLQMAEDEVAEMIDHHRRARDRFLRAGLALQEAAESLMDRQMQTVSDLHHDVVELAMILAEEIVGRELRTDVAPVDETFRRALQLLPCDAVPVVRVHPDDAELVREHVVTAHEWNGTVEVVGDAGVERGGCVLAAGECRIDAQIGPVIERVRAALR